MQSRWQRPHKLLGAETGAMEVGAQYGAHFQLVRRDALEDSPTTLIR
jgi:hypothetical protein